MIQRYSHGATAGVLKTRDDGELIAHEQAQRRLAQILQACRPPGDRPEDRDADGNPVEDLEDLDAWEGHGAAVALDSAAELIGEMFSEDPAEQRAFFLATFTTPNERS